MSEPRPVTYWDYLRVEELLSLQRGLADDDTDLANEEVLFVTVHQVYELWFKLVLRELRAARDLFVREPVAEQELSGVVERLQRIATIFRVAVHHFEVVETLGTRDYLEFRTKLMPASGFQSAQLRQIEILFGLDEAIRVPFGGADGHLEALRGPDGGTSPALERVEAQLADRPTFKEALDAWLARTPIDGVPHDHPEAPARMAAFVERFLAAHEREVGAAREHARSVLRAEEGRGGVDAMYDRELESVRAFFHPTDDEGGASRARTRAAIVFIESYRDLPLLAWPREVLAAVVAVEQAFVVFRQRHARMVERVIGRRTGTGGTAGVDYLDETARRYRIFTDLWAVRTMLVRGSALEGPAGRELYGFAAEG